MCSQNHRMAWVGRDPMITELQPPCRVQDHQPPHLILVQAAQGPIQPGLDHLQTRGIHSLSGQPIPTPHHSHSKELPPISNLNLPSFSLKPFPLVLLFSTLSKSWLPSCL